jgi:hypothetical protein
LEHPASDYEPLTPWWGVKSNSNPLEEIYMAVKIRKRNGRKQKYKIAKVIASLQKAGIETRIAHSIQNALDIYDGISSEDIKKQIYRILMKHNKNAAGKYWYTRGLNVNVEALGVNGSAIISSKTMTDLDMHVGDTIDVYNGEKHENVRVYPLEGTYIKPDAIQISESDMLDLGVHSGSKIAVRKHNGWT